MTQNKEQKNNIPTFRIFSTPFCSPASGGLILVSKTTLVAYLAIQVLQTSRRILPLHHSPSKSLPRNEMYGGFRHLCKPPQKPPNNKTIIYHSYSLSPHSITAILCFPSILIDKGFLNFICLK